MPSLLCLALLLAPQGSAAASEPARDEARSFYVAPPFEELARSGWPRIVERFESDLGALRRYFDVEASASRRAAERGLFHAWRAGLASMDFTAMEDDGRVDFLLLENRVRYELRRLDLAEADWVQVAPLLPFAAELERLHTERRQLTPRDPAEVAQRLTDLARELEELQEVLAEPESERRPDARLANRAAGHVRRLQRALGDWYSFSADYDPLFTWWVAEPHREFDRVLTDYARFLREDVAGVKEGDRETILGDPIGDEALREELRNELIPYTPAQLIELATRELEWCDRERRRAAGELGFGDDWRAAQEHVKGLHVPPGEQPRLIRELAEEAVAFIEERDLLTIPEYAKRVWRMEMMSPERQKYTPYFTGGEVISVSYPTADMAHADKLMSMRGNNVHFSRATVHHELIPGHHLQQYMNARHQAHRRAFRTPFWVEGWALYWEMLLWDQEFARSPEDRIGMLFWRSHRCARILFSLSYHLGTMTPAECIELLVERVGHERANATAEVRRSVQGGYSPLYQCAYMLGGLQIRALHGELVGSGRMTDRAFHDAVLRQNAIPIALLRARLLGNVPREGAGDWAFRGALEVR